MLRCPTGTCAQLTLPSAALVHAGVRMRRTCARHGRHCRQPLPLLKAEVRACSSMLEQAEEMQTVNRSLCHVWRAQCCLIRGQLDTCIFRGVGLLCLVVLCRNPGNVWLEPQSRSSVEVHYLAVAGFQIRVLRDHASATMASSRPR